MAVLDFFIPLITVALNLTSLGVWRAWPIAVHCIMIALIVSRPYLRQLYNYKIMWLEQLGKKTPPPKKKPKPRRFGPPDEQLP